MNNFGNEHSIKNSVTSQINLKLVSFCPISDSESVTVVLNIMQNSRSS